MAYTVGVNKSLPRRILVVDDDADAAWALARLLKLELGCEVRAANGGAEALDQASEMRPDVVIVDIRMPDVNGMDVVRLLRTIFPAPHTPTVIALTGLSALADRERILASGFDAYLCKPLDFNALLALLRG